MKFTLVTILALAAGASSNEKGIRTRVEEKAKTLQYYHYADNKKLCGMCRSLKDQQRPGPCDKRTGICPEVIDGTRCQAGWLEDDKSCQTPICDKVNCGSDGFCVAPNQCVCTALSTSDGEGGCYHLRVRGLIGAGAALLVLIISVSACAIIQTTFSKKNK